MSPPSELVELQALVREAARAELLPRFASVKREWKADGSAVTVADHAMQAEVHRALAARWPEYGFLGEEMSEAEQRALLSRPGAGLWIVDPLDGTSNFAAGIPFFSVSVALVEPAGPRLGVVYDPVRDESFSAAEGFGAWLNGERLEPPLAVPSIARATAIVDFKRLSAELRERLSEGPPYSSQRSFGSVALDWCWVAAGRVHLYLHGRQKIWDYAAGALILEQAGGRACGLDGKAVFEARIEPRSVLAALDADLFAQWRDWVLST